MKEFMLPTELTKEKRLGQGTNNSSGIQRLDNTGGGEEKKHERKEPADMGLTIWERVKSVWRDAVLGKRGLSENGRGTTGCKRCDETRYFIQGVAPGVLVVWKKKGKEGEQPHLRSEKGEKTKHKKTQSPRKKRQGKNIS